MEKKSFIVEQAELIARHWPGQEHVLRRAVRALVPHPGTLITTLLVVGIVLFAQNAGALPLRASVLASDSTTTISYQGRLADSSGDPVTSSGIGMCFRLYDTDTGGSPLWEECHIAVPVEDGLFHVLLGSTNPIPVSLLANNSTLWLGITVGSDSEMEPREQIASVPYAMVASKLAGEGITTDQIVDGAVTTQKLADDAVTSAKIAHTFGSSNKEMLNFVLNSDPTSWVYSSEAAPQGSWTTLDLSSVVSSKAVAVAIFAQLWTGTGDQSHVKFRQKGEGSDYDAPLIAFSTGVNKPGGGFTIVECDSSQNIEFYIQGGTAHLRIQVIGWWEPAHQ